MKKLIVFAAAAVMGLSALAGSSCNECTDLCSDSSEDQCRLWNVTLKLKTLATDTKYTVIKQQNSCSETPSCSCYMLKDATRTLKGVLWMCDTDCIVEGDTAVNFVLWDTKGKYNVSAPLLTGGETYTADTLTFTQLGLYTKKMNKAVAFWTKEFTDPDFGTIYAAGTKGSVLEIDDETRLPKSISGNAVGLINPASIVKKNKCADDTTEMGKIFAMCGCLDDDPCGSETGAEATKVAASGTWSIKYNKSLSKGKKTLAKIVPSYAQKKSE